MPPDTVLVAIVRGKPLKQLCKAIEKAGGEVREYAAPKPWELPKWVGRARPRARASRSTRRPPRSWSRWSGTSQQRLSRELEKLALAVHPGTNVDAERRRGAGRRATPRRRPTTWPTRSWPATCSATLALAEQLESHGERPGRLVFPVVRRLREVHRAAALLDAGMPEAQGGRGAEGAAVAGRRRRWRAPRRPTAPRSSARSACSPTSRSTCAAAATSSSTRTRPSRSRSPAPRPDAAAIRPAGAADAAAVAEIYNQGIAERIVDLRDRAPDGRGHRALAGGRRAAAAAGRAERTRAVLGWARILAYSDRAVYAGVGEVSVYVDRARARARPRAGAARGARGERPASSATGS